MLEFRREDNKVYQKRRGIQRTHGPEKREEKTPHPIASSRAYGSIN
jgi:hypothetical protein